MQTTSIVKHPRSEIALKQYDANQLSPELKKAVDELDKFEEELGELSTNLAMIDKSINQFVQNVNKTADNVAKMGSSLVDTFSNGQGSKAKGVIGLVALGIKGFGKAAEVVKKQDARADYDRKVTEILGQKQIVAEEKLPHLNKQLNKFNEGAFSLVEKMYATEFEKESDINDEKIGNGIFAFKRTFCIKIKTEFLKRTLEYYIAELSAWKDGKNDSKYHEPSIIQIISDEIKTWPSKFGEKKASWNDFIRSMLNKSQGSIRIPVATLLSDPCLLRNYVGINFGEANNCSDALIDIADRSRQITNPLVLRNSYYIHCKNILETKYNPPKEPSNFSIGDLLVLLIIPAICFLLLLLVFSIEENTGWRIFFMIPTLCWIGLGIEYLENHFISIFPYAKRISKYNRAYEIFKESIKTAENYQEIHLL